VLFILLLFVIPGSQILVYPILWILMPSEETVAHRSHYSGPTTA
jgi:phage shock protein PspC (stress-responsive transcriptional regulator)